MFCPNCGKEKVDNQDTCSYCGKSTSNNVDNENPYSQERAIYQDSISQNQYAYNNVPNKMVDDYMVWSVLTTIFCCLITGIVALVYSSQVNKYLSQGNIIAAEDASQKAKIWNIVGASICGAIILPIVVFSIIGALLGTMIAGSVLSSLFYML